MEFIIMYMEKDVSLVLFPALRRWLTYNVHDYFQIFTVEDIIINDFIFLQLKPVLTKHEGLQKLIKESFLFRALIWIILKVYTFVFMGYSLIPFVLLSYSRYMKVYKSMYFIGHVIFFPYPLVAPYIKKALRPRREPQHTD